MIKEGDKKISCIIPAYNEGGSIAAVLSVVVPLVGKSLYEVVVVDDGSRDNTREVVRSFPSVRLIEHHTNKGKSKSVSDGIRESLGDYIFMLDADLLHLEEKNVEALIEPVLDGKADTTISYRKNAWPLFPFKSIDYLSGERVFPRKYALSLVEKMARLPGYGLEVFLNRNLIIANQLRIGVVHWPDVENNLHHHKRGLLVGGVVTFKIWWNVLSTVSIVEMYAQNLRMKKLMVQL